MSITRVDISSEIQDWRDAVYGEEVRSANISALTKLQTQMNAACDGIESLESDATDTLAQAQSASTTANAASASAQTAITTANNAITQAQGYANAAAASATQAAGKVTDAAAYARDANTYKTDALAAKTAAETARDEAREAVPEDYEELTKCVSNPNLLDNWYLVNPVNQRGITASTWNSYGVDRWIVGGTSKVTDMTDGITLQQGTYLYQKQNGDVIPYGKTVTLSAKISGTIKSVTFTFPTLANWPSTDTDLGSVTFSDGTILKARTSANGTCQICNIYAGTNCKVECCKLEHGSISTLANDHAPNYAEELLKCQRYCIALKGSTDFRLRTATVGASSMDFSIPIPTTMRARPSLTNNGMSIYSLSFTQQTGFSFSVIGHSDVAILLRATKSSHGLSDAVLAVNTTSYLSADL